MKSVIISEEEVKKIAHLARLTLTAAEIKKFQKQLSETLTYITVLNEVKTQEAAATSQVFNKSNTSRNDETKSSLSLEEALSDSKSVYNDYFKVKSIF